MSDHAPTAADPAAEPHLRRALSLRGLVLFGLTYLAPVTVFTTYGLVTEISDNSLPAAYAVALAAMLFTAASYGMLARAYPVAGSAYTYSQQTLGGGFGFVTGWTLMLDYLFLPMVNFMLIGLYLNASFPAIPAGAFLILALVLTLVLNVLGIRLIDKVNVIIVALSVALAAVFVVLSLVKIMGDPAAPVPGLFEPFSGGDAGLNGILAGAAILALSFLGFDAVSTLSEEAEEPSRNIPRAIILTTLIGGLIFIVVSWVGSLVYPDYANFESIDTSGIDLTTRVGGAVFATVFLGIYLAGAFGSGMTTQVSVTRILYAMGRDGVLPKAFGWLHPKYQTPVIAAVVVSVVSCLGLVLSLGTVFTMVSFGALFAFSVVNLAVIKHFFIDAKREGRDADVLKHLVVPAIGFVLTVWLWTSLTAATFKVGLSWMLAGVVILAIVTRGFSKPAPVMDFSEKS